MRACIQRVTRADVRVNGEVVGSIAQGLVVLLGVGKGDTEKDAMDLAQKVARLRIFEDAEGKMNHSVEDLGGQVLVVSQFTLLGDCRRGRRPSFSQAADPEVAQSLYETFTRALQLKGVSVERGQFRAHMQVELVNDGPVTLLLDTEKQF
jgi:D-tyrosyl-tRNA(Tyr) deacylase